MFRSELLLVLASRTPGPRRSGTHEVPGPCFPVLLSALLEMLLPCDALRCMLCVLLLLKLLCSSVLNLPAPEDHFLSLSREI